MKCISLIIQIFHAILSIYTTLFPHIYQKYDLYYIIYLFFLSLHWYLSKGECIITFLEKKLINKSYKLGDTPHYSPYHNLVGKSTINILNSIFIINYSLILYRNYNTSNFNIIILITLLTIYLRSIKKFK
jgi:hypothetical protein